MATNEYWLYMNFYRINLHAAIIWYDSLKVPRNVHVSTDETSKINMKQKEK